MELWKTIKDFSGYEVSNKGNVKSYKSGKPRLLKSCTNSSGYQLVVLSGSHGKKSLYVHRLVSQSFLDNPNQYPQVNHKDEDKSNNSVENLEWCTPEYNMRYGTGKQRSNDKRKKQVLQMTLDGVPVDVWESTCEAGRNGYSQGEISSCCRGILETHKNHIWRYV